MKHGGYEIDFEYSDGEERNGEKEDDEAGILFNVEHRLGAARGISGGQGSSSALLRSTESEPSSATNLNSGGDGATAEEPATAVKSAGSGAGDGGGPVESDEDQTIALKQFNSDTSSTGGELAASSLFPPIDFAKLWGLDSPATSTAPVSVLDSLLY